MNVPPHLIDGRLSSAVVPKRYDVTLSVEPDQGRFSGSVAIQLHVLEAVRRVTLHALELEILEATAGISRFRVRVRGSEPASADTATV